MTMAALTTEELRAKLWEWGPVVALALIPALPLLIGNGLINTRAGGDSPFMLVRVHQLVLNLRAGVFPARWMPHAAYGLGYPFFNFYASLPYYLAAIMKILGIGYIWSIKLTQALGFVFAATAVYGFSKELHNKGLTQRLSHQRCTNLLIALVYSCAPFHMVNVYVRGDSLSEFYAFAFFPLILWALLRLQKQASVRNAAWIALSYAGLVLTHNISAVIFSPFVFIYALWLALTTKDRFQIILKSLGALALGLLMSCWFWLPALAERGNVHLKDMTTGYFNYALHFRGLDLLQRSLVFDYAITAHTQPFCMGFVQALLAIAGLVAAIAGWVRRRQIEPQSAFIVFSLVTSTLMITPLSRPLWDHLPLLPLVQFPWRFLSLQALPASLLVAYIIPPQRRGQWATFLLGLLVLIATLSGLQPEWLPIQDADVTAQRLMLYEYFTTNIGTTVRHEYLPRWVDPRPYTSEALWPGETKPVPLVIEGQISSAHLKAWGPTFERWFIEVTSTESLLAFHTYYYPGWEARIDGQQTRVDVLPGLGYISVRLGQGLHEVSLCLGHTKTQLFAEIASMLAAGWLLFLLFRDARFNLRMPTKTILIIALAALLATGVHALTSQAKEEKTTISTDALDLTMDFDRMPYLHHNPDGICFNHAARLTHYGLSLQDVAAGQMITITTCWDNVRRNDLVAKVSLVSPAQQLFSVPQTIATNEMPITASCNPHVLRVPTSIARGIYLLSVQAYSPEGEIKPITARGEVLGTTYLLPVHISGKALASGNEPILQLFGERIALSEARAIQCLTGTLEVTLTWRVLAPPLQNYKIALRLKDRSGWDVARLDTQPGYGFYPTSMWQPGELVSDHYTLSLDDGTPPGTQYRLDVTLYEAATLHPIGTASVPNIVITYPTVQKDYQVLHQFGPIALLNAQLPKVELQQGEELAMLLKWAATTHVDRDYACQLTLLNQAGMAALSQTVSLASEYATSLWPQDAVVTSHYALQLDPYFPVGGYTIALTVIEIPLGKEIDTFILPTHVHIVEALRSFTIPPMQRAVGADFGGQIRLLGYDLQRGERKLSVILYWQALTRMDADYKIFVHLFDPTTERIVAQQDILAGGEDHSTRRWVPREVISSHITLSLEDVPAGVYRLAVGLYQTVGRLPVAAPLEFSVSADRLLLTETIQVP